MPLALHVDADNVVEIDAEILKHATGKIVVKGSGSRIRVGRPRHIVPQGFNLEIIAGARCTMLLDEDCFFGNLSIHAEEACDVSIGKSTSIRSAHINAVEGQTIAIGSDCMVGNNIRVLTSDFHPIFDLDTGRRMNLPEAVRVGHHVWLADDVVVLKGAVIGDQCAIGIRSVVSGVIPEHSLAAGVPARVLKSRIRWERDLP